MKSINGLKKILSENLSWNKARIDCLARLLLSLFSVRTVNLSELAVSFPSKTKQSSRYKRLQRFFRGFQMDYLDITKWIFRLFKAAQKIYLVMDRTNWFWGKSKINILTLGIAYEGVAIPLLWKVLDKAGNAIASEHAGLTQGFINLFGTSCIEGLLADREFGSGYFFKWLNQENIPFYIRIKEGSQVYIQSKKFRSAQKLFAHLNPKEYGRFDMDVELFGQKVFLAGSRSERGELMIVATNVLPKKEVIAIYLRRWEIETLFGCLKSRGFRFEDTHITHVDRIEKMMALLAIGVCWAHKTAEWRAEKKPIRLSPHRESLRPQNSFFRYGLDWIRGELFSLFHSENTLELRQSFKLLMPNLNKMETTF